MLENLKKEMNNFFKDIDEHVKDKEEQLYLKQRTSDLVDFLMDEIAAIRKAVVELKVKALRAEGGDRTEQDRESDEIRRRAARLLSKYDDKMTESDYYYSEILAPGGIFIPDYWKYPKTSVLYTGEWSDSLMSDLPEDLYLFDKSL